MSNIFCRDVLTLRSRQCHRSDMNLADSSVVYCASGLSCPTFSDVPIKDLHCCVSRSSNTSAPSCKPLFIVFEPEDALRLLKFFLANETKLISQSQCVRRIVNPKKSSTFHATFLRTNSTVVKNPGSTRSQTLTLNVSRINCSRSFALTLEMAGIKPSLQ